MGASAWSYFVPYQEDISLALQQLKDHVFAEGNHYPIAWYQYLLSQPINLIYLRLASLSACWSIFGYAHETNHKVVTSKVYINPKDTYFKSH